MEQFPPEEINRIENIPHLNPNSEYDGISIPSLNNNRSKEILKLALKTKNQLTGSIICLAALKHDPFMIPENNRSFIEPEKDIHFSIANAALENLKDQPSMVEKFFDDILPKIKQNNSLNDKSNEIEIARKAGYVQGVCECVAVIGDDHVLGKKLLSEMNVTKDMAKKFANPKTFKKLEQGIFAETIEQKLQQTQGFKR